IVQSRTLTRPFSLGIGVRLNTDSDSIGPVWSPMPQALNPTGPSSAAIQRRGTVQKHSQSTQRLSIQIEGGSRLTGRCRRACDPVFCGPATGADAPKAFV